MEKLKSQVDFTRHTLTGVQTTSRSLAPTRCDIGRIRRGRDPKVGISLKVLDSLRDGLPLYPKMTRQERISLALTSTRPTHHVTITTMTDTTREEVAHKFRLLVQRIERNAHRRKRPLIYVGNYAQGFGDGGYHLHLLLWEEPHYRTWITQSKAVGLGRIKVKSIDRSPEMALDKTAYVLGQHESVFGTNAHLRHRPRAKGQHRAIYPKMGTLERWHPKLFHALKLAKAKSVTDETLVERLPIFI